MLRGCLWLVFLRWNEPLPTDRKSTGRLSSVIELKNEFTGDVERNWQRDYWRAGAIRRRWRIVLDHTDSSFDSALYNNPGDSTRCQLQTLCLKRTISYRERHGRIRGRFTPVRKWVPT